MPFAAFTRLGLSLVVDWFWRRRRQPRAPRLRSREEALPPARIDLKEFAPGAVEYLARAAYVQLTLFEDCSRAVAIAPSTAAKEVLARTAGIAIDKHRALVAELERRGADVALEMERHRAVIDRFQRLTQGQDWYEAALTCYLAGGFLDDLFLALADGLPGELPAHIREILARSADDAFVVLFTAAMNDNPRLPSRLALWGRRILGDALLVARDALVFSEDLVKDEQRIEPAFSELVAQHTRRMDVLGLSA